ncbi:MAG: mechanosensitive ion channel protein [Bermanella sp.]|nr:mechanosensitive ion channel protein [Bermanella sp.]|tara:strand:- start:3740 stop:4564 length:825 start_codon:yes stop_codon:yes gene_type:complete
MDFLNNFVIENQAVIQDYGLRILVSVLIIWLGFKFSKLASRWVGRLLERKSIDTAISAFVQSLVRILILIAVIIAGLSHLGIETTTFVTIIGAAGLAIALALQGSLSNFASGILIAGFRPFKAGDYIEAGGVAGVVKEIQIFSTVLTTPDNKRVVIPNAQVTGSAITNYSSNPTRRIDLVIGVAYDADLKETETLLKSILDNHPLILKEPAYTVGVLELADSSVNFAVRPWVNTADFWAVKFELNQTIKQALDNAGIGIPFPQMDVHFHQNKKG